MQQPVQAQVNLQDEVHRNRYVILALVLAGILMSVLDGYMVSIALPTITMVFSVSFAESQWVITGYLVVMTGLFVIFAKASEYTGTARMFMAGWALFTISSLACSLSAGIGELIIFRIAQAIGASMVAGVSGAILFQAFPRQEIGKVMGYYGAVVALGSLIGPGLGGLIVDHLGWPYLFLVNVPIGIALLAGGIKYLKLPEIRARHLDMDWPGAATLLASVASLMLLCGELASRTAITMSVAAYGALFILSAVAFIYRESRCEKPLLALSMFRNRLFSLPVASTFIFSVSLNAAIVLGPFYYQGVMQYNVSQVGLLAMVVPLVMLFTSPISGRLYDKHHWKYHAGTGVMIAATGLLLLGFAFWSRNFGLIIVSLLLWGAGNGLFVSPNSTETMSALPREKTAMASSLSTTSRSLGGALGISIASILLMSGLGAAGNSGGVMAAGPSVLANTIGMIMIAAGALCVLSAIVSILRNI